MTGEAGRAAMGVPHPPMAAPVGERTRRHDIRCL